MYGYRQSNDNALMTNLNSISSSLSSIDTIGRRNNNNNNSKASADNLITLRSQSIASTSLLWKASKDNRHSLATIRNGHHRPGSEIYHNRSNFLTSCCLKSETALNCLLVPLLLLTITRQVFDFLGPIWLQIIINFFTIIILIVALFGVRQHRTSYLSTFLLWALFNTAWNFIVFCIHTKVRDVGIPEDALSLYTGATSWWHMNGPGCLPYNMSSIQPSMKILQPNMITGCRIDYHLIESTQAAIHAVMFFVSSLFCCCIISNIRRNPHYYMKKHHQQKTDKSYRLNNLMNDRSKVNPDPLPDHYSRGTSNSLRRAANKTSSRSSQHSASSMRSARRRRQSVDGTLPTPRGSTSSTQRSQKYGSLSSRRSSKKERRGDIASLTYGTTGVNTNPNNRTRLSSLSSADYLPSYQPPHSSNANLLSSYGEISSIDSYNDRVDRRTTAKSRHSSGRQSVRGNTNPTYAGSRSSICSHNTNANNYDDLSYIYGNTNSSNKPSENLYGASTSSATDSNRRQHIYQSNRSTNSMSKRNGFRLREQPPPGVNQIQAETYQQVEDPRKGDTLTKSKFNVQNGSFHSFAKTNQQQQPSNGVQHLKMDNSHFAMEINNNHLPSNNYQETYVNGNQDNCNTPNGQYAFENRSRVVDMTTNTNGNQTSQIYAAQRSSRHPIYSNHLPNGNSETPI